MPSATQPLKYKHPLTYPFLKRLIKSRSKQLPKSHFKATKSHCPICADKSKSTTSKLRCGHVFHGTCVFAWFDQLLTDDWNAQLTCPLCRDVQTRVNLPNSDEGCLDTSTLGDYRLRKRWLKMCREMERRGKRRELGLRDIVGGRISPRSWEE